MRTLRARINDRRAPLPHYRMKDGRFGKVLVRKLEFDAWIRRYHVVKTEQAATRAHVYEMATTILKAVR